MRQMHISTKRFSLHSYEGFGNDVEAGRVRTIGAVLILDEVHRIRNAAGKNAKTIEHASRDAHRVVCLSGTPMVNNVLDLSSQVNQPYPSPKSRSVTLFMYESIVRPLYQRRKGAKCIQT